MVCVQIGMVRSNTGNEPTDALATSNDGKSLADTGAIRLTDSNVMASASKSEPSAVFGRSIACGAAFDGIAYDMCGTNCEEFIYLGSGWEMHA